MENLPRKWTCYISGNAGETDSDIRGQYLPPVPEDVADKLSENPLTLDIMKALEWNHKSSEELETACPGSALSIPSMVKAGLIRSESGVFSLNEAYYDHPNQTGVDEIYWFLVSEKREWGLFLKDIMDSLAMRLIAKKFGIPCDEQNIMDLNYEMNEERLEEASNRLFDVLISVFTDENPDSVFERWTKEVH